MTVKIIGVGNAYRRDDGAGLAAARLLHGRSCENLDLAISSADPSDLLAAWEGADSVILLDAAAAAKSPGRIIRTVIGEDLLPPEAGSASSHDFGVAAAIALADALGDRPETIIVYTVEGADFGFGEGLSSEVADALPELADRAAAEASRLAVHRPS